LKLKKGCGASAMQVKLIVQRMWAKTIGAKVDSERLGGRGRSQALVRDMSARNTIIRTLQDEGN